MRAEVADFVQDLHQVLLGERVAMRPGRPPSVPVATGGSFVGDPDEGKPPIITRVRQLSKRSTRTAEAAECATLCHGDDGQTKEREDRNEDRRPMTDGVA